MPPLAKKQKNQHVCIACDEPTVHTDELCCACNIDELWIESMEPCDDCFANPAIFPLCSGCGKPQICTDTSDNTCCWCRGLYRDTACAPCAYNPRIFRVKSSHSVCDECGRGHCATLEQNEGPGSRIYTCCQCRKAPWADRCEECEHIEWPESTTCEQCKRDDVWFCRAMGTKCCLCCNSTVCHECKNMYEDQAADSDAEETVRNQAQERLKRIHV